MTVFSVHALRVVKGLLAQRLECIKRFNLHSVLLQVVLWSLGDHVTSLSNHAQGTFDGKRERLSSRLTLKVCNNCAILTARCMVQAIACAKLVLDFVHQCVPLFRDSLQHPFMQYVVDDLSGISRNAQAHCTNSCIAC